MPQQPSPGRPDEGSRTATVTVLNHSLHLRSIDLGPPEGVQADASTPRRVLTIPAGQRNELKTEIIPGQAEVTAEEWKAIGEHPTARWLVRPKDGRTPVLTRAGF